MNHKQIGEVVKYMGLAFWIVAAIIVIYMSLSVMI